MIIHEFNLSTVSLYQATMLRYKYQFSGWYQDYSQVKLLPAKHM